MSRPELGVLMLGVPMLSQHVEATHIVHLIGRAGFGYLLKDRVLEVEDFLACAERVARGGSALDLPDGAADHRRVLAGLTYPGSATRA